MTDATATDSTGRANSSSNSSETNQQSNSIQASTESTVREPHKAEKTTKKGKRPTAFAKECVLSPELAAFLGQERMTRSDVVSSMWKTIRERGLIDPNQKQFAVCDEQLFKVIGRKRFKVFGMMKFLKSHVRDATN
ncbi:hypothetical protein RvY_15178 [Ramazzottius varieornatus]|uniref:DM2 domain-containing protein n=1 Tax=Ramazzottius varieornatus TaxID=947166 RepID=A0A1D1W0X8_RAMVA|nr:hypothetical protein RvY_15178 [Ramazzottius varieornatus]